MARISILAGLVAAYLLGTPFALADKFSDTLNQARTQMNALGDKALAGDNGAILELDGFRRKCPESYSCHLNSTMRDQAAVAAANLGWLYWTKAVRGEENRVHGMGFYVQAAKLDYPAGLYQLAECILTNCLGKEFEAIYFKDVFQPKFIESRTRAQTLFQAIVLLNKAARNGLTQGAIRAGELNLEYIDQLQSVVTENDPAAREDAIFYATHNNVSKAREIWRYGLDHTNPNAEQKAKLEKYLADTQQWFLTLEAGIEDVTKRQLALNEAREAAVAQPPKQVVSSAYQADLLRAKRCVSESREMMAWDKDLKSWRSDLRTWNKELDRNLQILRSTPPATNSVERQYEEARWSTYEAEERDFNAQSKEYNEELGRYERAEADQIQSCNGNYDTKAVEEACGSSDAARTPFCKSFKS